MEAPVDAALLAELRARIPALGSTLVVRSSSPLEGEGRWAGAFTSYLNIAPEQIEVAVRGCWASVYSRDVLERCENEEIDPSTLRIAILIQPMIEFEAGGAARADANDVVHVTATSGSPAELMTGWVAGEEIVVDPKSTVPALGTRVIGGQSLIDVAELTRRSRALLGDDAIEWGYAPKFGVVLLQCKRTATLAQTTRFTLPAAARESPEAIAAMRLARLVRRFPGWLGEEVVLPWAILVADDALPDDVEALNIAPAEAREDARILAHRLVTHVWNLPGERAYRTAMQTVEAVRSGNAGERVLERIARGADVDRKQAVRLLALVRAAERGGATPGRDRWEPFLFSTVHAYGERRSAAPVVEGIGAGRARYVDVPETAPAEFDRRVLIVPRPLNSFAPLLWNAAALVTLGGGAGAHLMEIARSLAVPAVMRCRLDDLIAQGADDFLLAVDGTEGSVSVLPLRG
jgi:phosphohistidine swiveling domain-containing protein